MHYVISDIHGKYDYLVRMLRKIRFSDQDTLYVLGDVVDRGEHPIKVLQLMMMYANIFPVAGNHERMAMSCLQLLNQEISDEFLDSLTYTDYGRLTDWIRQGGQTTMDEYAGLDCQQREDIMEYLGEFSLYEEVFIKGTKYLLVHAGLSNFSPDRSLDDYQPDEMLWERPDYSRPYFRDVITVSGHTPTQLIAGNDRPGYIYYGNGHIAIDCGACYEGGRLSCLCLDDGREYYEPE